MLSGVKNPKHFEMNKIRISNGYSSYFLDILDSMFLSIFEQDLKSDFNAFANVKNLNFFSNLFNNQNKRTFFVN